MAAIYCVLRTGGDYQATHVERLYRNIASYCSAPFRFVCLSDVAVGCERIPLKYPWKGWFSKMELCRPDIAGDMLYLDLDTVIVGNLENIMSVRRTTVLRDFYWDRAKNKNFDSIGSGLMYLTAEDRARIWKYWSVAPFFRRLMAGKIGDQHVFETILGKQADRWQDILPGQVISYKANIKLGNHSALPTDARIVCFHGKPRPRETQESWIPACPLPPTRLEPVLQY